eukprot:scaffold39061_cov33-Attheya_sp.AAC.2
MLSQSTVAVAVMFAPAQALEAIAGAPYGCCYHCCPITSTATTITMYIIAPHDNRRLLLSYYSGM